VGLGASDPLTRSLQIRGELKAGKSKPPPAEETTGAQANGARPDFMGNSKRDASSPVHRTRRMRFWQPLSRIDFMRKLLSFFFALAVPVEVSVSAHWQDWMLLGPVARGWRLRRLRAPSLLARGVSQWTIPVQNRRQRENA
jgi:hypothetical protein